MTMSFQSVLCFTIFCFVWDQIHHAESANILGLFPTFSKSHFVINEALMKKLAVRGHNVTIVSGYPPSTKKIPPNYHEIYLDIGVLHEIQNSFDNMLQNPEETTKNPLTMLHRHIKASGKRGVDILNHPKMQALMNSGQKFDLMVYGWFKNDFLLGVGAHFQCPIAVMVTVPPLKIVRDMVGNPASIASVPFVMRSQADAPRTFTIRLMDFIFHTVEFIITNYLRYFVIEPYYNEHFPAYKNYPSYGDVMQNISLLMVNSHFSMGKPRPYLPNVIEISGIQVKDKPDPLPQVLQEFLDEAIDGAILFSFGSNAKVSEMSEEMRSQIFAALRVLKQKIVMKWETDDVPNGLPSNILLQKWMPQTDILAHPNTKLFISHCGMGSVNEARYHGVPILAIPIFGDQPANAANVVAEGWAVSIPYYSLSFDSLSNALNNMLSNDSYALVAKEKSLQYRDRPQSAMETAVFWTEYVIRHRGARHLRSDAANMNVLQTSSIDVIAFLALVLFIFSKIVILCTLWIRRAIRTAMLVISRKAKYD